MKPIVKIIGECVDKVRIKYDTDNNEKPFYDYGPITDMVKMLGEKNGSKTWKFKKYPLIWLVQDFTEDYGREAGRICDVPLRIIIVTHTEQNIYASERYNTTIEPILYPILWLLIDAIEKHPNNNQRRFEFKKTDRLHWGKSGIYGNEGYIDNDYLDAIELTINLKIIQNCN